MRWLRLTVLLMMGAACDSGDAGDTDMHSADRPTDPTLVVVGVYTLGDDGSYIDMDKDLTFTVGASCETWTRTSGPHGDYTESHDHHNAADASYYEDETFHWTEYGPEHAADDIDTTCAAGEGGADKHVDWDTYYEEDREQGEPFYLRIKSAA